MKTGYCAAAGTTAERPDRFARAALAAVLDPTRARVALAAVAALVASAAACGGDRTEQRPAAGAPGAGAVTLTEANTDSIARSVYVLCATCHGESGRGVPGVYPPLAGSSIAAGPPEIPIAIVLHGLTGPITVSGVEYNGVMTPWGGMFNDVQVAAVLTWIRRQWGQSASAVSPETVARVREATASRTTMWTWEELQQADLQTGR